MKMKKRNCTNHKPLPLMSSVVFAPLLSQYCLHTHYCALYSMLMMK